MSLKLSFVFPACFAFGVAVLWYAISYANSRNGTFLRKAEAVFQIPGLLPSGYFVFLEFNQTFNNDTSTLHNTDQQSSNGTDLYLNYLGVLAPSANINWGNRLRVQIVEPGDCGTAAVIGSAGKSFPNCTDYAFLHDRATFNKSGCPQGELTCMHGLVWMCVDELLVTHVHGRHAQHAARDHGCNGDSLQPDA